MNFKILVKVCCLLSLSPVFQMDAGKRPNSRTLLQKKEKECAALRRQLRLEQQKSATYAEQLGVARTANAEFYKSYLVATATVGRVSGMLEALVARTDKLNQDVVSYDQRQQTLIDHNSDLRRQVAELTGSALQMFEQVVEIPNGKKA